MEGLARTLLLLVKISTDDKQTSNLVETALLVIRAFLKQAVERIARIRLVRPMPHPIVNLTRKLSDNAQG